MEIDVGLDLVRAAARLVLDALHRRRRAPRSPRRCARSAARAAAAGSMISRISNSAWMNSSLGILVDLPAQHVRIEHVPVDASAAPACRSSAATRVSPLADSRRIASRTAVRETPNSSWMLRLGRQRLAGLVVAGDDAPADRAGDHFGQASLSAACGRLRVSLMTSALPPEYRVYRPTFCSRSATRIADTYHTTFSEVGQ